MLSATSVNLQWLEGGTKSRFTECGGFFGVCWVCRMFDVGPLAWRLQAVLCGRCSWAGPWLFGVHWVLWGFRSGSVDVLDVVFCSIVYAARVKKLHCQCGFTYCCVCDNTSVADSTVLVLNLGVRRVGVKHHNPAVLHPGKTQYSLYRMLVGPEGRSICVR
jgi:hypothetical protein